MLKRFTDLASSSIGKKALMSVSGLLLIGFLIAHLLGNSTLWLDSDGAAFNHYAQALDDKKPYLYLAEIGLLVLFAAHIALGLRVTFENRAARSSRYALERDRGARSLASSSMIVSGILVLVFLVIHLLDFRLRERASDGLAAMVVRRLTEPTGVLIYLVGVIALGVHLSHAFRSALQTLGVNHPRYNAWILGAGRGLALVLGLGFALFPILLLGAKRSDVHVADRAQSPQTHVERTDTATPVKARETQERR